ncbi:MAG: aldo/keto reductase, partial [Pseudomonadota bacterium]
MLESTQVGRSGLFVSRLCLGTMNFGVPGQGQHGDWTLNLEQTRDIIRTAIDSGVFYFDCADYYGHGASEEVVGKLLRELLPREEYVLATKIGLPMGKNRNLTGLSRKHILEGVDHSLQRLGLEYVDKLVIHRHPHGLPWHAAVPIEETLEALHDVVKAGKVLYLGASSMWAWQFAELQHSARLNGWSQFISMQNHYNLIYREEEREMIPYCAHAGVGVTPWSPLARGILTGAYKGGFESGTTNRSQGSDAERSKSLYHGAHSFDIANRVAETAANYGVTSAQIAIAWLLSKPAVTAPVVGVSRPEQLKDLVNAATVKLEQNDIEYLEELYEPLENLLSSGIS